MKNPQIALLTVVPLAAVLAAPVILAQSGASQPPVAKKLPHITDIHGYKLTDDYFWLRQKSNPDVTAYLEAENAYTEDVMKPTKALQETLYKEMLGRIKQTDLTVPSRIGEYVYYSRTEEGKQYPYMCRRKGGMEGAEEILLDVNALAQGHKFLGVGAYAVSDDANWLAYSIDSTGYRQYTLHVKDLRSGQVSTERIERVTSVAWATDNKTLIFATEDAVSKRRDKVFRHVVGTPANDLIFEEKDELFDVSVGRSLDKKVIFISSGAKTSSEDRYCQGRRARGRAGADSCAREPGHEYDVDHYNGEFYITTNKGAKNFKVVKAPIADPSEKNWKPFIAHKPGAAHRRPDVLRQPSGRLRARGRAQLPARHRHEDAAVAPHRHRRSRLRARSSAAIREFNTTTVRFTYQSMVTPSSVYDYDLDTRQRTLLKRTEVLGGYDPASYESRRIWAAARDGTKVPISLVYRKGTKLDGSAPMLLYRLRLVRLLAESPRSRRPVSACSIAASSTRWPTSAAAASSARNGASRGA